jgi:UTP--glucose-1-phosphate uridylyltransferase
MRIRKAVITAAGRQQRNLPLQTLIDRDGQEKSVLTILVDEALRAKAEEICVVIAPGDGEAYRRAAADHASGLRFVEQDEPAGYGHAIWCSRDFTKDEPFLHLVADHVFVGSGEESCASAVVQAAESQECSVSAVQPTREGLLTQFGAIGGHALADADELFQVETVLEKPTPTEAEQRLIVPGLRAGHYLCYFGLHVLTPTVMEILGENIREGRRRISLSEALAALLRRERYLALRMRARRFDLGMRYGLLTAQVAFALNGRDREEVLARLVELLAARELH